MLLEGLARALTILPDDALDRDWLRRKEELIEGVRVLALTIWPNFGGQDFETGAGYSANDYRDEILFSILGKEKASTMLS
jgi:hypothetical protein